MRVEAHWELRSEVSWKLNILPNEYEPLNFFNESNYGPLQNHSTRTCMDQVHFKGRLRPGKMLLVDFAEVGLGGFETGGMRQPCVDLILVHLGELRELNLLGSQVNA